MKIVRIGCEYFLNFGEWNEITFSENDNIISIIGQWQSNPKRSNRSGKSSFVEIISYVLYGKTRADKEIQLINKNYPEKDMRCLLEFDDGVIISRGRSTNNEMFLEMTGFEGADKKVLQEEIDKYIGMTYQDFIMTCFFEQGDIHTFMNAGGTGQKQIISRWLDKAYWKTYEKSAKDILKEIEGDIIRAEVIVNNKPNPDRKDEILANINNLNQQKSSLNKVLNGLNEILEAINDKLKKVGEIEKLKNQIEELNNEIEDIDSEISDLGEELVVIIKQAREAKENEILIKQLEKELESLSNIEEALKFAKEAENTIRNKLSDEKAELRNLKKQYEDLDNFDMICPVTKLKCESAGSITSTKSDLLKIGSKQKKVVEAMEKSFEAAQINTKEISKQLDALKDKNSELKRLKKAKTEKELNDKKLSIKEKISTKKTLSKTKTDKMKSLNEDLNKLLKIDFDSMKSQKNKIILEINVNNNELNDIINNEAALKAELYIIEEKQKKVAEAEVELSKLNHRLNIYKYVSYMFSKNGIPSNQIEVAFDEIETETNIILDKLQSGMIMEFQPDKEINKWEDNCLVCGFAFPKGFRRNECPECGNERQKKRKDDLNILIFSGENEMEFNLESGGGKVLVSLAIRLAFVRLLRRRLGARLELIVFDEIFGMLDEVNREQVFKLLTETLKNDFNFNEILVISHEEEIRDVIPNVIKVIKLNKFSTFDWE